MSTPSTSFAPPLPLQSDSPPESLSSNITTDNTLLPSPSIRKACDSCRLSKARCEPGPGTDIINQGNLNDNSICQRCAKTGRRCVYGERSRRRKRRKTEFRDDEEIETSCGDGDKVSILEKKVSLLEARLGATSKFEQENESGDDIIEHGYQHSPTTTIAGGSSLTSRSKSTTSTNLPLHRSPSPPSKGPQLAPNPLFFFAPSKPTKQRPKTSLEPDVIARDVIPLSTATALYNHFSTTMLPHFPFFSAAHSSFAECRHSKPMLFLAILSSSAASSGSTDLHHVLLGDLYATLARRILSEGEKSLEIVQAIIITVTWYHPPVQCQEKSRLWNLAHQAAAMAIELNFGASQRGITGKEKKPQPEELEERRALLTCYSSNATISVVLRRPIFLRYGRRIQESLEVLEASGEMTDKILVGVVTLMRMIEEAAGSCGILDGDTTGQTTPTMVRWILESFERRVGEHVRKVTATLPDQVAHTSFAFSHFGAIIQVFSIIFELPRSASAPTDGFYLRAHSSLLAAAHGTIETFLSIPLASLQSSPFNVFSRAANACSILLRLALENTEQLALNQLRVTYYLTALIDRLRELMQRGARCSSVTMSTAIFEAMRQYYHEHCEPEGEALAAASILCGRTGSATHQKNDDAATIAKFSPHIAKIPVPAPAILPESPPLPPRKISLAPPPCPSHRLQNPMKTLSPHRHTPPPPSLPTGYTLPAPPPPAIPVEIHHPFTSRPPPHIPSYGDGTTPSNFTGMAVSGMDLAPEEIEAFLAGIDGQIMMMGSGGGLDSVGVGIGGMAAGLGMGWVQPQQQQEYSWS